MELRSRCATCRQTGHTVCPPVVVSVQVPKRKSRVVVPVARAKCCSFCSRPGHYKPKCEKYKIFVQEVKPHDADNFMTVAIDQMLREMQKMFSRFLKFQFTSAQMVQVFQESDIWFRHIVQLFIQAFDQQFIEPQQQPALPQPIALELCENTSRKHVECGICLSDNIPCSKMVKLGCGHEFCGDCTEKLINAKPCCAFCRADVKQVIVASKSMLTKFKKNNKFSV